MSRSGKPLPVEAEQVAASVAPQRKLRKAARPAAVTKALAEQLQEQTPELTRQEVAERLGISDRRLRTVAPRKQATPKVAIATGA